MTQNVQKHCSTQKKAEITSRRDYLVKHRPTSGTPFRQNIPGGENYRREARGTTFRPGRKGGKLSERENFLGETVISRTLTKCASSQPPFGRSSTNIDRTAAIMAFLKSPQCFSRMPRSPRCASINLTLTCQTKKLVRHFNSAH